MRLGTEHLSNHVTLVTFNICASVSSSINKTVIGSTDRVLEGVCCDNRNTVGFKDKSLFIAHINSSVGHL